MREFECADAQLLLHALLDGELDDERADALRHHLDACEHCLDEADLLDHLKQLVQRSCPPCRAPESLRLRIVTEVRSVTWSTVHRGS